MPKKTTPKAATNGRKPDDFIIDLDAIAEPAGVLVNEGKRYPFRKWDSLSINQRKLVEKNYGRLIDIERSEEIVDADDAEYERIARELVAVVVEVPEADLAQLNIFQCIKAVADFLSRQVSRNPRMLANLIRSLSPSEKSSSDSQTDSEAIPSDG